MHCIKVSVFGVILFPIFPQLDWMRTRITPNTDIFYAFSHDFMISIDNGMTTRCRVLKLCSKFELFRDFPVSNVKSIVYDWGQDKYQ